MNDPALLGAFEACTLTPEGLGHREHVRLAWLCLRAHPRFEDGARRFCAGLRRFAAWHGKASSYHETITWAYLALVNERLQDREARMRDDGTGGFDAFAARNPDLLEGGQGVLRALYGPEVLRSKVARDVFLLPRVVRD